jgi:hypothetical protein
MHTDPTRQYRPLLDDDPRLFDWVNTPWDHVPGLEQGVCFVQIDDCTDLLL